MMVAMMMMMITLVVVITWHICKRVHYPYKTSQNDDGCDEKDDVCDVNNDDDCDRPITLTMLPSLDLLIMILLAIKCQILHGDLH